jgi:rRNA methylase, putative, group 3
MFKSTTRSFSKASILYKTSGVKPVFKPHHPGTNPIKSFEKNFPYTEKVGRPWEEKNLTKDEFFMRKYGNVSEEGRKKLLEKVERQRRARDSRKENERAERARMREERVNRRDTRTSHSSFASYNRRNPLFEYVYGTHSVRSALSANKRDSYNKLYVHNCQDNELITMANKYGIRVVEKENKNDLNILCNNGVHNGVVLETKALELPTIQGLGECSENGYEISLYNEMYDAVETVKMPIARAEAKVPAATETRFPLGLFLDGITDPQNMGGIIRTAYYFGVDFIVVPDINSARLGPVASKASVGSLDMMSIYKTEHGLKFIDAIRKNGWNVVSTASRPSAVEVEDLRQKHDKVEAQLKQRYVEIGELSNILSRGPVLLVMGSEGDGVRTHIKLRSDYLVGIDGTPNPYVDSLNVSVAVGILLAKCLT